jgi:cytochrome o ubiquinol oxidase operon protein cyoD
LALLQFIVQIYCLLHLGKEAGSRARLFILGCAILIVGILVGGSLWIMFSLNGRMMPDTAQMEQYMTNEDAF